jgi:hypothetical protein
MDSRILNSLNYEFINETMIYYRKQRMNAPIVFVENINETLRTP